MYIRRDQTKPLPATLSKASKVICVSDKHKKDMYV